MRYTRDEVARVARIAFELARSAARNSPASTRPTSSKSRNSGAPPSTKSQQNYPGVTLEHQFVDSMAMHLMNVPRNFDVVLTENLFGDILCDESGVITGSLGMLPSATIGGKVNLYEPVHGSAPDIAGTGKANPLGAILTAAMILRHSAGLEQDAKAVEAAVHKVLNAGYRTADLARAQPPGQILSDAGDGQTGPPGPGRIHRPSPVHARRMTWFRIKAVLINIGIAAALIYRYWTGTPLHIV